MSKLQEYLKYKKNPSLAMFESMASLKSELKEMMQSLIEKELAKRISEITQIKGDKGDKPTKQEILTIVKEVKQWFKGEKGDQPTKDEVLSLIDDAVRNGLRGKDARTPIKGIDYSDGRTPKAGVDYPTKEQMVGEVLRVMPKPQNGRTPIRGIDYLTKEEINDLIRTLVGSLNLKFIFEELEKIKKEIEGLRKQETFGRRTLHRGGIDFNYSETLGTGDGTTLTFDLDYTPYDDNSLPFLFVGGGVQFKTDDWTRSGKNITFLTAPPLGAVIRAPFYRKG